MSMRILQAGLQDTVQDMGRYGVQHLGINPGGAMDRIAMSVANSLAGNERDTAVVELHFPAAVFLFEKTALIALTGADFGAAVNGAPVPMNKPLLIAKDAVLHFTRPIAGARCYLSVHGGWQLTPWLGSYSTNVKAGAGGLAGKALQQHDRLTMNDTTDYAPRLKDNAVRELPWFVPVNRIYNGKEGKIRIVAGNEWHLLEPDAQQLFTRSDFYLTTHCDRMGFRLKGAELKTVHRPELLSAGVSRGTIQLLPDGQLIILMADHQTTGGYPKAAHVISADQPLLAQWRAAQPLRFEMITHDTAEILLWQQEQHLRLLQKACKLRLEAYDKH